MLLVALLVTVGLTPMHLYGEEAAPLSDEDLALAIIDDLRASPEVPVDYIDVDVEKGVVELSGMANTLLARERAEEVASKVRGVRSVVNRIIVEPDYAVADVRLERIIERALEDNPTTEDWEINIAVLDSTATLSGVVDSWQEKVMAERVAKGVDGVRSVVNDITVNYATRRSDEEIREDVVSRLKWDLWVDDALIDVTVDKATVTLDGTVGSLAEKRRAYANAWVSGVVDVEDSDLAVEWDRRDEMRRSYAAVVKDDASVAGAVRQAMLYDPRTNTFNVDVRVQDGVAILTGTVSNLIARNAAEENAKNTLGVWRVRNYLTVRPEAEFDDEELERDVENRLAASAMLQIGELDVQVRDGVAYLYGEADNSFAKRQATKAASSVGGVRGVRNNIEVYGYQQELEDWELKQDIVSQLYWSPFVDSDDVTVEVENGVVMLSGQVDTWSERASAYENAREGGAAIIHNRLTVEGATGVMY